MHTVDTPVIVMVCDVSEIANLYLVDETLAGWRDSGNLKTIAN